MTKSRAIAYTIVYAGIALALLAAYVFFYLHIQSKNVQAAETVTEVQVIQDQNAQFQELTAVVRDIKASQEKLDSYFVQGDAIIEFLEAIEQTGDISGTEVEVRSIDEGETDNKDISELTLDLVATGTWEGVYHLLVLLESFPVASRFDRIQINEFETDEEGNTIWRATFDMKVLQLTK